MKVLIGTPVKDMLPSQYVQCLSDLIVYSMGKGIEVDACFEHGGLYEARDRICSKTLDDDYDYMLQIDSDQTFPKDALEKLLARDKDIISGLYFGQGEHHKPVIFSELHPADENGGAWALKHGLDEKIKAAIAAGDVFEVAGCGAGFFLVSNHALRLMKIHAHHYFETHMGLGEDVSFCYRAINKCGLKVYCDPNINIGHLKFEEITMDDWDGILDEDRKEKKKKESGTK